MAKPPTSVRSIRLADELWATIEADAAVRGEKVNGAIARHLRIAYQAGPLTIEHIVDVTVASPFGRRAAATSRPPEPTESIVHVSVPTFERKPFNPQPKAGKKK